MNVRPLKAAEEYKGFQQVVGVECHNLEAGTAPGRPREHPETAKIKKKYRLNFFFARFDGFD